MGTRETVSGVLCGAPVYVASQGINKFALSEALWKSPIHSCRSLQTMDAGVAAEEGEVASPNLWWKFQCRFLGVGVGERDQASHH